MGKRGQISIFFVVGILLLMAVTTIYLFFSGTLSQERELVVPEATTPLQKFVSRCIEDTARQGLFILGHQGGHIELPEGFAGNPSVTIADDPASPLRTPYWYVGGKYYIPSPEKMEEDLAAFIDAYIGTCLGGFESIPSADIVNVTAPRSSVRINEEDVVVLLDYEVVSTTGRRTTQDSFAVRIPLRLTEIIDTAAQVAQALRASLKLERATIDLMAAADPSIPMSGMQMRCDEPVWTKFQVQRFLEDVLYYNIPKMKVMGTDHAPFEEDLSHYRSFSDMSMGEFESTYCDEDGCDIPDVPRDNYVYNHMYLDAGLPAQVGDHGITVGFSYLPTFGMEMTVRPEEDGIMRSVTEQGDSEYLSFFCMNVYHFTYDVVYPVQVVVRQEEAFNDGKPFLLRFAMPVMIKRNLPDEDPSAGFSFATVGDSSFCQSTRAETMHIYARDVIAGQNLDDATISFECVKFRCPLGETRSELNGIYRLSTEIPSGCYGGFLVAKKDGYTSGKTQITGQEQSVDVEMMALTPILYHIDLAKTGTLPVLLTSGQTAYVSIESQNFGYSKSFIFDPDEQNYLEVLRLPEVYNISITVYDEGTLLGGYIGQLEVNDADFRRVLTLHAYEKLPHPDTPEEVGSLFLFLKNNKSSYHGDYRMTWN